MSIVLHEVEKCPQCGEIILTEEQMEAFVEKLKRLNLWKEEYGIVKLRKNENRDNENRKDF